jgi:hypothetical protein
MMVEDDWEQRVTVEQHCSHQPIATAALRERNEGNTNHSSFRLAKFCALVIKVAGAKTCMLRAAAAAAAAVAVLDACSTPTICHYFAFRT